MTKTPAIAALALAMLTGVASAQQRTVYDSRGRNVGGVIAR
jgi:hypothetical protein